MIFTETNLRGCYVIDPETLVDPRGFFARTFCAKDFEMHGLNPRLVQCSTSFNNKRGTLRGMHYQISPYQEAKLVRCTRGAIYDVVVDLRPQSSTFRQWKAMELTGENRRMFYIPEGFAHGFQTLEDETEVFYQMTEFFHPEYARGLRWNDPALKIEWPRSDAIVSRKDSEYPDYQPDQAE